MGVRQWLYLVGVAAAGLFAAAGSAVALEPQNVLVLVNAASGEGQQIASAYQQAHPGVSLLALEDVPLGEEIYAADYLTKIRQPVLGALDESVYCIVTTKGLPLRIINPKPQGWTGPWHTYSSLESELTKVDTLADTFAMAAPWVCNTNYYAKDEPFNPAVHNMRLSARLDGFSVQDVTASLSRALGARKSWPGFYFHLDDDPEAPGSACDKMEVLRDDVLAPRGLRCLYDPTDAYVNADDPGTPGHVVLGYVSHGVYGGAPDNYILDEDNGLSFQVGDGAVFHTYESYNAYSFVEGGNRNGQGLVAEWIRLGGTVGIGHVEEPGVSSLSVANENVLFEMLLDGYCWAEAAWGATTRLSHVNTVVGDPLMRFCPWTRGDANGDDIINSGDLAVLGTYYGVNEGATWKQADFNGDGAVNVGDLGILGVSFGGGGAGGGAAVPEPASSILLVLSAVGLLSCRRKRR